MVVPVRCSDPRRILVLPALVLCSAFVWFSIKAMQPGRSKFSKFLQNQKGKTAKKKVKGQKALRRSAPQMHMDILVLVVVVLGCMFYGAFSVFSRMSS